MPKVLKCAQKCLEVPKSAQNVQKCLEGIIVPRVPKSTLKDPNMPVGLKIAQQFGKGP